MPSGSVGGSHPLPVTVTDPLPAFRLGLIAALSEFGYAPETPEDLMRWALQGTPRALIISVDLPGRRDELQELARANSRMTIMVLSTGVHAEMVKEAALIGCSCLLDRALPPEAIVQALGVALSGHAVLPRETLGAVTTWIPDGGLPDLTRHQMCWLRRLSRGHKVEQIAHDAGYSTRAMHRNLAHVYRQLGVEGRLEAIAKAARMGVL